MMGRNRGFSAIELMAIIAIAALFFSIAIPTFGSVKLQMSFQSGEQAIQALLARARWSAINSGREETRVSIEGNVLRIRAGTAADSPIVASIDASEYNVTLSGTNLPVQIDARGRRTNVSAPTVTITNSRISAARTFTVGPLGKVTAS